MPPARADGMSPLLGHDYVITLFTIVRHYMSTTIVIMLSDHIAITEQV
jgi:hypothetical protein